jgi:saccharopine dehydrogenase-like NADP-dependent oxidoreductase
MKEKPSVIIAGAGGIAKALALILAEWSPRQLKIWIGNRTLEKAEQLVRWAQKSCTNKTDIQAFHLPEEGPYTEELHAIFERASILLDCLPGSQAPRMAQIAVDFNMHYANLTEYVKETEQIKELARHSDKAFVLQSGLAPGFINVLAHGMFQDFCQAHGVDKVDEVQMRVGALSRHAAPPTYYGFTWSPVGVATEYVKPAIVIRHGKKTSLPSLSERREIRIEGLAYEEDLTSGGAADLPDALEGKVTSLDYKTIRYPGHYAWITEQMDEIGDGNNQIELLQAKMEAFIPHLEDDLVIVYAAVQGIDRRGALRREEKSFRIFPSKVGNARLRAIQTTTAGPMAEVALMLLGEHDHKGIVLQSMIDASRFLSGAIIKKIYT